jgi:hypothetical protein
MRTFPDWIKALLLNTQPGKRQQFLFAEKCES